ncbi:MAG TPA: DUF4342 domain-containing protein [Candidatus Bathyarchaeia archaeon]|jgi:uncharacterized membrane protein
MYCRKCGKELSEEDRYCSQCGTETRGTHWEEVTVATDDLIGRVKELIAEGNVRRIVVRNDKGEQLLEIPVTAAAIGTLIAPYLAALGVIAALVTRVNIHVERRDAAEK